MLLDKEEIHEFCFTNGRDLTPSGLHDNRFLYLARTIAEYLPFPTQSYINKLKLISPPTQICRNCARHCF